MRSPRSGRIRGGVGAWSGNAGRAGPCRGAGALCERARGVLMKDKEARTKRSIVRPSPFVSSDIAAVRDYHHVAHARLGISQNLGVQPAPAGMQLLRDARDLATGK